MKLGNPEARTTPRRGKPQSANNHEAWKTMKFGKTIKGVILDIDGVLLDSMGIWKDLGARYLAKRGVEPEAGLGETLFSMSMEQGASYLKQAYGLENTPEEIKADLEAMLRSFYFHEVRSKEGAKELLDALNKAGVKMVAATSSPREHIEAALERNGLLTYISNLFTNAEVGSSKHSPEIYDAAANHLGLANDEVCVFEDSLYALRTAVKAGYHTVGVYDANGETDQRGLEDSAEVYVRSLTELRRLFS